MDNPCLDLEIKRHQRFFSTTNIIDDRIGESRKVTIDEPDFDIEEAKKVISEMWESTITHLSVLFDMAIQDSHKASNDNYTPEDTMTLARLKSEYRWIFFDDDEFVTDDFKNDTADILPDADILLAYYVLLLKVVYKK